MVPKHMSQATARKRNPNLNFFGQDSFGWGGGLPREGVGAESSVCPSKPGKSNFFFGGGYPRILPGYPGPEGPEKFEKKKFVFNFRSLM